MSSPVAPTTLTVAVAADPVDLTKITARRLWEEIQRRQGSAKFTAPPSQSRYAEEAKRAIQRLDLAEAAACLELADPELHGLLRLVRRALEPKA